MNGGAAFFFRSLVATDDTVHSAPREIREDLIRLGLAADLENRPVLLDQLRVEFRRNRAGEPGEEVPVLLGHEALNLALAFDHELQRDGLHAAGAHPTPHLVPEERADLVADETVEDPPRLLRIDHLHVDVQRLLDRLENCFFCDLVEHQPTDLASAAPELFGEMPPDRLPFPIRVGRDVNLAGLFGGALQLGDDLLS